MAACDVLVVGAGFGGLGAALTLAERGAKVVVCEALKYPGGCASTFTRDGHEFESGATLFSGLERNQLFGGWIQRHGLDVTIDWLDPVVELRTPSDVFATPRDRGAFERALLARAGRHADRTLAFLHEQRRVADALWSLLDDPALLPPFGVGALLRHAGRVGTYAPLVRLVGRPLLDVLRRHGIDDFPLLRTWVDAVSQITVQGSAAEVEAPFALATMDYFFRGTGHVRGGIGKLADALVGAIRGLGGEVRLPCRVKAIRRDGSAWIVETSKGDVRAGRIVANVLPQGLSTLIATPPSRSLDALARDVEDGWGAVMLYLVARTPAGLADAPEHLELVADPAKPFVEGNHLFVSISGAADRKAPAGLRTLTISTHVAIAKLRASADRAAEVAQIQARMRATLHALAPEWSSAVVHEMTASPRTFERFTRRAEGLVGGIPRRAGLHHYRRLGLVQPLPGLYLVGDSVFPGQSTLATALGGVKVAEAIARHT